jgi:hypothetical protein
MSAKNINDELVSLLEAAQIGIAAAPYREYVAVKIDYDQISLHSAEKEIGWEKAEKELNMTFTSADKWVMIKKGIEDSNFTINVNDVVRELGFPYREVEKRIRLILLLRDEVYEQNKEATIFDVLEKWRFSTSIYGPAMKMVTYLSVLMNEGNEVDARKMAGYVSNHVINEWKRKYPDFGMLYREAIGKSILSLEDRLRQIAECTDMGAPQVQATKLLLERIDKKMHGENYDRLSPNERIEYLKRLAFVFAADKGANLREALKLLDPSEYGGLDDVNVKLPEGLKDAITQDAPTELLLQMKSLLEQYKNNQGGM